TSATQISAEARILSCRKSSSASTLKHIAGISNCASIDCAKNNGETQSIASTLNAGAPGASRDSSIASRNVNKTPNEANSSIAMRVLWIENPNTCQNAARYAITPGGCTFGV